MHALLISPQSEFSFWTLPESCRINGAKMPTPPLGLLTVAALLPSEWDLRFVDLNTKELTGEDWEWADLVMVTAIIGQMESFRSIVERAKSLGKTVVAGGPYPTSMPAEMLSMGVDYLLRGEAENTLPLFLDGLSKGRKGIYESQEKPELTTSPIPRYDLLNLYDYLAMVVQTSRGCPFECEFCDIVKLFGRRPRYKSPRQVMAELELIHRLGWRGTVFIVDDNFIGSKQHARAILDELIPWNRSRGESFHFMTQASVNLGSDPEMIDLLTAANFGKIFMGIESADTEVLEECHKRQNIASPIEASLSSINRNGLTVLGSFIIGFDAEQKGADRRICRLVEQTAVPIVMQNLLNALPGTRLWTRLEKEGRLLDHMGCGDSMVGDTMNFVPARPRSEIFEEFVNVWDYVYEPSRFFARASRYFRNMRPTRKAQGREPQTPPHPVKSVGPPRPVKLRFLRGVMGFFWRQGIRSTYRLDFWRNLIEVWRENPSRLYSYLDTCGLGENMFRIREMFLQERTKREEQEGR